MSKIRTVVYYKNYYWKFFNSQREKVKRKISWTIDILETHEQVPVNYLKHIENSNGLYEIRIQHGGDIFRIFCFFDEGKLVIAINGFQKKSQKTPPSEIELAQKIKNEYENEKKQYYNPR